MKRLLRAIGSVCCLDIFGSGRLSDYENECLSELFDAFYSFNHQKYKNALDEAIRLIDEIMSNDDRLFGSRASSHYRSDIYSKISDLKKMLCIAQN